ncbi:unnamed protein product [Zymoseptoria tritici ST99CH_3D1]|nr:unnamed protein product [Zymoseptoria tritici ST99CH_3D1]
MHDLVPSIVNPAPASATEISELLPSASSYLARPGCQIWVTVHQRFTDDGRSTDHRIFHVSLTAFFKDTWETPLRSGDEHQIVASPDTGTPRFPSRRLILWSAERSERRAFSVDRCIKDSALAGVC